MPGNEKLIVKEARQLKDVVQANFWRSPLPYQLFASEAKTVTIGAISEDLVNKVGKFLRGEVTEEDVRNKFTYVLDLLDFYLSNMS